MYIIIAGSHLAYILMISYEGAGPKIDKISNEGNPQAIHFPRAKVEDAVYDFSFSGLKSAVLNYLNSCEMKGEAIVPEDVAASFQAAVVEVLVTKTMQAAKEMGVKRVAIAGGVSANKPLREALEAACIKNGYDFCRPEFIFCTDNAAMIGIVGYMKYLDHDFCSIDLPAFSKVTFK